jgi:uncharacterized protein YjbI with pentapeptide repeats
MKGISDVKAIFEGLGGKAVEILVEKLIEIALSSFGDHLSEIKEKSHSEEAQLFCMIEESLMEAVGSDTGLITPELSSEASKVFFDCAPKNDKEFKNASLKALRMLKPNAEEYEIGQFEELLLHKFLSNEYLSQKYLLNSISEILTTVTKTQETGTEVFNTVYELKKFAQEWYKSYERDKDTWELSKEFIEENNTLLKQLIILFEQISKKITNVDDMSLTPSSFPGDQKKSYYDHKWMGYLFLNSEGSDNPKRLKDTFIMPSYKILSKDKFKDKFVESDYTKDDLDEVLKSFITGTNPYGSLLIQGFPGMGKTSISAYLANEYINNDRLLILPFREYDREDLANERRITDSLFFDILLKKLKCKGDDLSGKIIVLDGFDELPDSTSNKAKYSELLKGLFRMGRVKKIKFIITTRYDCIEERRFSDFNKVINLQYFPEEKIASYQESLCGLIRWKPVDLDDKRKIFGIPIILYLALSTNNFTPDSTTSIAEFYETIFRIKGGIFERFRDYLKTNLGHDIEAENDDGYENAIHPLENVEERFRDLLMKIAFYMFKKRKPSIDRKSYDDLISDFFHGINHQEHSLNNADFPISKLYDGTEEMEFVHGTVREFFLAEYLYQSIKEILSSNQTDNDKKIIAGRFGEILHYDVINEQTKEFLNYKFRHQLELNTYYQAVEDTFILMLEDGMMYYSSVGKVKKILRAEYTVFFNMLIVIHEWELPENKKIPIQHIAEMADYIKCYGTIGSFDLSRMSMEGIDLFGSVMVSPNLSNADLNNAKLSNAKLRNANLRNANLNNADLSSAYLRYAYLRNAYLRNAYLRNANLNNAYLRNANLSHANLINVDLSYANLRNADLSHANLSHVDLSHANLSHANLSDAYLLEVDFTYSELNNIRISHFISSYYTGCTFDDHNIRQIENLENIEFAYVLIRETGEKLIYPQYVEWKKRK